MYQICFFRQIFRQGYHKRKGRYAAVICEKRCPLCIANMALHEDNGQLYCDASDLDSHLSVAALSAQLSRARRRGRGNFQNIANPFYNSRNSKRWVLLESIPPELRQQESKTSRKQTFPLSHPHHHYRRHLHPPIPHYATLLKYQSKKQTNQSHS